MTTEALESTAEQKLPLDTYVGKKVKVTYQQKGKARVEDAVGVLEESNPVVSMFRPRGKVSAIILRPSEILDYGLDDSKPVELKQKSLKNPTLNTVRAHLADRHAFPLDVVNEMDEESAFQEHLEIDHAGLSHTHPYITDAESEVDGTEPGDDDDESDEDDDE